LGRSLHIPRDLENRPLQAPTDSFPTVQTAAGRILRADGGVFPDLVIEPDTLTTVEQNLLVESARAEIPLSLRVTEFAFEHVRRARDGTGPEELDPRAIPAFFDILAEEGLSADLLEDPVVRDYLSWRVKLAFAQRAEHYDHALEFQAERDRILAKAIRFLETSNSQGELFAAVDVEAARARRAEVSGSGDGTR
jgi:hypothetical protein